jgi:hypothetical protein
MINRREFLELTAPAGASLVRRFMAMHLGQPISAEVR